MAGSLFVKNRPLGHYVLSVFSLLFRDKWHHEENIYISAPSRTIGRTVDLANLLCEKFASYLLRMERVNIGRVGVSCLSEKSKFQSSAKEAKVSTIEVALSAKHYPSSAEVKGLFRDFLDKIKKAEESPQEFSICEIEFILSTLLKEGYAFSFSCPAWMDIGLKEKKMVKGNEIDLGKISVNSKGDIQYNPLSRSNMPITVKNCQELQSYVESGLMRMGILQSDEYGELARDMCQYDDIIVAVDTNMFYKGQVTSALLDSFVGIARSDYLDTPNWIMIVASTISIGEIEHKANRKPSGTGDTVSFRERREACRGLQEFIEIGSCVDLEGVSLLLTGETPPEFNFSRKGEEIIRDETMRHHVKNFFKSIDFHKGTYFLTQDKICEMFAKAEGLHAFYLPRKCLKSDDFPYSLSSIEKAGDIHNVSELVYELGVELPLEIVCHGDGLDSCRFIIETDWAEKSVEDWENRRLRLTVGSGGSKALENRKQKAEEELEKLKENKKKLQGSKGGEHRNKKIVELEKKIKEVEKLQRETETTSSELIEKLRSNGIRVGLDELL